MFAVLYACVVCNPVCQKQSCHRSMECEVEVEHVLEIKMFLQFTVGSLRVLF